MGRIRLVMAMIGAAAGASGFAVAVAAQEVGWTWADRAELSVVWTGGNATSNTIGIKNTLTGESGASKFNVEAGGVRTESSLRTRVANGTASQFTVTETTVNQVTAESYFARSQYNYGVTEQTYAFGGGGWNRNTFSGITNRFSFVAGAGFLFSDADPTKFRADVGVTYTVQDNVAVGPTARFAGLRLTYDLSHVATETATFQSKLVLDENLADTDDIRVDLENSLAVAMNSRLALKTSLQLLFDNQPSFVDVPLFTGGAPAGTTVPAQLQKVDTVFTVALVINVK